METRLLIVGKGDDILTMIFDNLSSNGNGGEVDVLNNLNLKISNNISHPKFVVNILENVNVSQYEQYCLGVYSPNIKKILPDEQVYDWNTGTYQTIPGQNSNSGFRLSLLVGFNSRKG